MGTPIPNLLTVVFLLDDPSPTKLFMMQRAADKKFAPNLYTGPGGKIDIEDGPKGQLVGAKRELDEEIGLEKNLKEFGRLIINNKRIIYYFYGFHNDKLALPKSKDGKMEWVNLDKVLEKEIVPTTKVFIEAWQERKWNFLKPFSVTMTKQELDELYSPISDVKVYEGLLDI